MSQAGGFRLHREIGTLESLKHGDLDGVEGGEWTCLQKNLQLQGSMAIDWDPRCGGEKMRSNDGGCKRYDALDMQPMWLGE